MPEKPRQLAVPAPYGTSSGRPSSSKGPDTIRAVCHCCSCLAKLSTLRARVQPYHGGLCVGMQLREKLSEFKNENSLLGSLVKDLKASCCPAVYSR